MVLLEPVELINPLVREGVVGVPDHDGNQPEVADPLGENTLKGTGFAVCLPGPKRS